jgi:hypothetical protein
MNIVINGKKLLSVGLGLGLLTVYFLGMSVLGMSVAVPYAFLWVVYELRQIQGAMKRITTDS